MARQRFTLHAENVPALDLLIMALGPFHVLPKPDANGVTVYKLIPRKEGGESGERHVRSLEEKHAAEEAHGLAIIRREGSTGEEPLTGAEGRTKVLVRSAYADGGEAIVNPDGTVHRNLTFNMEEKGVPSVGKLVLDIKGVKVD